MDRDFLKKVIKEGVVEVVAGDGHKCFMRVSGQLDTNFIAVMQNKDVDMHQRLCTVLCMILCDAEGNHLFDFKNEDDIKLVSMMPDKHSVPLIEKLEELFMIDQKTDEKKTLKEQA